MRCRHQAGSTHMPHRDLQDPETCIIHVPLEIEEQAWASLHREGRENGIMDLSAVSGA